MLASRTLAHIVLAMSGLLAFACSSNSTDNDGSIVETPDAGMPPVWVVEPDIPTKVDLFAIWGRSRNDIWAVGWSGEQDDGTGQDVTRSTIIHWDGMAWSLEATTATVPLQDIHGFANPPMGDPPMPDPNDPIFAVGFSGTVLQRTASGSWAETVVLDTRGMPTSTLTQDLFGVYVGDDNSALAVGAGGKVLGWNGMNWQTRRFRVPGGFSGLPIEPLGVLKGIWSANGDSYYISGSGGAAYRSAGGFQTFEALYTAVNEPLRGVWGQPGGAVFTVGLGGLILRFDGEWNRVLNQGARELPKAFFFDIDGAGGNDITIVGWRGTIVRYLGGQWIVEDSTTTTDLRGVWVDRETGTAFAVGASGLMLRRDPPPPPDAGPVVD